MGHRCTYIEHLELRDNDIVRMITATYKDKKDTCSVLCIAWYPIHICIRLSRSEPAVGRGRHITVIVIIIINKKS